MMKHSKLFASHTSVFFFTALIVTIEGLNITRGRDKDFEEHTAAFEGEISGDIVKEEVVESNPIEVNVATSRSSKPILVQASSNNTPDSDPNQSYFDDAMGAQAPSSSYHPHFEPMASGGPGTSSHHSHDSMVAKARRRGRPTASLPSSMPSSSSSLSPSSDYYDYYHPQRMHHRPTLTDLTPDEASTVNTPEELLAYCCQFPACYDPLYELCIDTCRKCETVYPVTSWLPCPPLLNIPDCTSSSLSAQGRLPLACYPDIGPFANILPVSAVMKVPTYYNPSGRHSSGNGNGGQHDMLLQHARNPMESEQMYRKTMQKRNKKQCNHHYGICISEKGSANSNVFHGFGK